jgi:hypothetical protein
MITRDQAREIAEGFLVQRGPMQGWQGLESVLSPEDVKSSTLTLSGAAEEDSRWRSCWMVLVRGEARGVIYISAQTGDVEFVGSVKGR